MAALLAGLAVMSVLTSMALPVWRHAAQREREAELIFRGEQYARAIRLYQRARPGAYPPDVATLVEGRFLRRAYRDPMTPDGAFRLIRESELEAFTGAGGAAGAAGAAGAGQGSGRGAAGPSGGRPTAPDAHATSDPTQTSPRRTPPDRPPFPAAGAPQGAASTERSAGRGRDGVRAGDRAGAGPGARRRAGDRRRAGVDGGIAGVVSTSASVAIARYRGRARYSEWVFLASDAAAPAGGGPDAVPPAGRTTRPAGRTRRPGDRRRPGRRGRRDHRPAAAITAS